MSSISDLNVYRRMLLNDLKALAEVDGIDRFANVRRRLLLDDHSDNLHSAQVWKLNSSADPADDKQWLRRDVWITLNFDLCYFSVKEGKRSVLIDATKFALAELVVVDRPVARQCAGLAFQIRPRPETDAETWEVTLAAKSREEYCLLVEFFEFSLMQTAVRDRDLPIMCSHIFEANSVICSTMGGDEISRFDVPEGERAFGNWLQEKLFEAMRPTARDRLWLVDEAGSILWKQPDRVRPVYSAPPESIQFTGCRRYVDT